MIFLAKQRATLGQQFSKKLNVNYLFPMCVLDSILILNYLLLRYLKDNL